MADYAVFDLDDTLLDLETELRGFLDVDNMVPNDRVDNTHILDTIAQQNLLATVRAFPKAVKLVNELRHNNIKIKLITARGWYGKAKSVTEKNLEDNEIEYDELVICNLGENKVNYLNTSNRYLLSLEDNPYNHVLIEKSLQVVNPFCIMRPAFDYNNVNNLIKCHSEIRVDNILN